VGIIIIAIGLGLLGAFISYRAGLRSIQVARRQASWPERRRLMSAGWRYFGLAFLLIVLIIAVPGYVYNHPEVIQSMVTRPEPTGTNTPFLISTITPASTITTASTDTSVPTDTPIPSETSAGTLTPTHAPSRTPLPTDTLWPTMTPTVTPTKTLVPSATKVMTAT